MDVITQTFGMQAGLSHAGQSVHEAQGENIFSLALLVKKVSMWCLHYILHTFDTALQLVCMMIWISMVVCVSMATS